MLRQILSLTKVAAKAGLCGGALYLTKEQGVWGNVEQGEAAYYKLRSLTLKDLIGEEYSSQVPALPQEVSYVCNTVAEVSSNLGDHYNSTVVALCDGLDSLPESVADLADQAKESAQKMMQ